MKTIGNIIWVIFGGLEMAIAYFFRLGDNVNATVSFTK